MHYYLVSDLHMGGDAELQTCDYAEEFIQFLQQLSQIDTEAELIIGGDTFGFWELTELEGPEKLDEIIHHHQPIFNQIKQTGTSIKVTMMVGNHDYDLACNPVYVSKLADYNITLDTSLALVRPVADRQLWIEHGQQDDNYNASPQYGNPYALPIGYFITEYIVSGASHYSAFGQGNWLKDIRSVGTLQIPEWIASNYFYREMSGIIRWMVLPFLLLFGFTFIAIGLEILRYFSLFDINLLVDNTFPRALGLVTDIVLTILTINAVILLFLLTLSIPLYIIFRDVKRTLRRFGVVGADSLEFDPDSNLPYFERARTVFSENPDVAVYVFGHTHDALLQKEGDHLIINTGTWLKILHRVTVRFGYLPPVYVPTFRLNYFKIYADQGQVAVEYVEMPKSIKNELTWLQQLVIWGRQIPEGRPIPKKVVI